MSKINVAIIQPHWQSTPEANLENVLNLIDKVGSGVDFLGLPEFFLGPPFYFPGMDHLKGKIDDTIPGRITEILAESARKYNMYICGGTIVEKNGDDYYNTSFLLDNKGAIVGKSRKIHCFAAEMSQIKTGEELTVVDTPFAKIGLCVCSDFWIQEVPRMLALKGAELLYISGSSLIQNIDLVRPCIWANSINNVCYTLYSSVVGKVVGKRADISDFSIEMGGFSTIASPKQIVKTIENQQAIMTVELDMELIRDLRKVDVKFKKTLYWCLWGRRPELYKQIMEPYIGATDSLKDMVTEYLKSDD